VVGWLVLVWGLFLSVFGLSPSCVFSIDEPFVIWVCSLLSLSFVPVKKEEIHRRLNMNSTVDPTAAGQYVT
jgi:hypothetical protein